MLSSYLSLQAGVTSLRFLIPLWLFHVSFAFGTMSCDWVYTGTGTAGWSGLLTGLLQSICIPSPARWYPTKTSVELLSSLPWEFLELPSPMAFWGIQIYCGSQPYTACDVSGLKSGSFVYVDLGRNFFTCPAVTCMKSLGVLEVLAEETSILSNLSVSLWSFSLISW